MKKLLLLSLLCGIPILAMENKKGKKRIFESNAQTETQKRKESRLDFNDISLDTIEELLESLPLDYEDDSSVEISAFKEKEKESLLLNILRENENNSPLLKQMYQKTFVPGYRGHPDIITPQKNDQDGPEQGTVFNILNTITPKNTPEKNKEAKQPGLNDLFAITYTTITKELKKKPMSNKKTVAAKKSPEKTDSVESRPKEKSYLTCNFCNVTFGIRTDQPLTKGLSTARRNFKKHILESCRKITINGDNIITPYKNTVQGDEKNGFHATCIQCKQGFSEPREAAVLRTLRKHDCELNQQLLSIWGKIDPKPDK